MTTAVTGGKGGGVLSRGASRSLDFGLFTSSMKNFAYGAVVIYFPNWHMVNNITLKKIMCRRQIFFEEVEEAGKTDAPPSQERKPHPLWDF